MGEQLNQLRLVNEQLKNSRTEAIHQTESRYGCRNNYFLALYHHVYNCLLERQISMDDLEKRGRTAKG